jgi:hypothetical protein
MLDKIDQPITPGVWIAYGHVSNSAGMLRLGYVLEIKEQDGNNKSCPWLREDRIKVWGISDDHATYAKHNPGSAWASPMALSKASTLKFPDRVVVIPSRLVPAEYQKMIDGLGVKI